MDALGEREVFSGFTNFEQTYANYLGTDASLPSMFQGNFFKGGQYDTYQKLARTGGIRAEFLRAGYVVSTYTPDNNRFWAFDDAHFKQTSRALSGVSPSFAQIAELGQVVVVRALPAPLRLVGLSIYGRLFPFSMYGSYRANAIPLIDSFSKQEINRPATGQYVYLHVILPHGPFLHTSDCERTVVGQTSYSSQIVCAVRMMAHIIRAIRATDHFDNSLIIFSSDHGFNDSTIPPSRLLTKITAEASSMIEQYDGQFGVQGALQRASALLLIKPPGSKEPLEISSQAVQLVDIPSTIAVELGWDDRSGGVPVFQSQGSRNRSIDLFFGASRLDGIRPGSPIEFGHARVSSSGDWTVLPIVKGIR